MKEKKVSNCNFFALQCMHSSENHQFNDREREREGEEVERNKIIKINFQQKNALS